MDSQRKVKVQIGSEFYELDKLPDGRFSLKGDVWVYRGKPKGALHHNGADGMDPILNHADGQIYDSRSRYMQAVKDMGCQVVGDEKISRKKQEHHFDEKAFDSAFKGACEELNI